MRALSLRVMLRLLAGRRRGPLETREHELQQAQAEAALAGLLALCPDTDEELIAQAQAERRFVD